MKGLSSFKAKVIEPCGKLFSKLRFKHDKKASISMISPTFRMPRHRIRPRIRAKVARFKKPFSSISYLGLNQCRPKRKIKPRTQPHPTSPKLKKGSRFRRSRHTKQAKKAVPKVRIAELLTVMFSLRKAKEVEMEGSSDKVRTDVTSSMTVSDSGNGKEPFPSPTTPAYVRLSSATRKETPTSDDATDVEDVFNSFETYMVEMIVEEGKLKDLMDVEELLCCWKSLKNPVFVGVVRRFYGQLCRDLLSSSGEDATEETSSTDC